MPYLLVANIFIQAKSLQYGFDFCPALWEWLDANNRSSTVFNIEKVRDELVAGGDELANWARQRGSEFFLVPDVADLASLAAVSTWARDGGFDPGAVNQFLQVVDYYLVAQAHARVIVVVSHDVAANSMKKMKIPNACIGLRVKFMSPYEMLRTEMARSCFALSTTQPLF